MRHVVVIEGNRIVGVLRVNTALRRGSPKAARDSGVKLRDIASRNFTIAREEDIMFNVIRRMWRKKAVDGTGRTWQLTASHGRKTSLA